MCATAFINYISAIYKQFTFYELDKNTIGMETTRTSEIYR